MISTVIFLLCVYSAIAEPLYAIRAEEGLLLSVVSVDPARGFMTDLVNLRDFGDQFPNLLNVTCYDAATDTFAFGNSDPPLLGLANTLAKKVKIVYLPLYGKLLALAAYDGTIFGLFGGDEDLPTVGHLVSIDIVSFETRSIGKWKIPSNETFYVGTPFTFLPNLQSYIFQLVDPRTAWLLQQSNGTSVTMLPAAVQGGWDYLWSDVSRGVLTLLGSKQAKVSQIEPMEGKITPIHNFPCGPGGMFSIDFRAQKIFQLSSCKNLSIETVTFANKSLSNVNVDAGLSTVVSIQAANTYVPFGCGASCSIHLDCAKFKSCHTCRLGKCSDDGECGDVCFNNADCFAGVCAGNCEEGRCGRKGCAAHCNSHDDCKSVSKTCTVCRLGRCCDAGECGNYCLSPTDCYGATCNGKCSNYKCSP